ncbi:SusE outer membrane protein [Mucilaginibacter pineti]|uniref:SusE outer membrane protein n=1 Tax=Mucilaginibacter pineti TaxID=1391627 RepID=A0A1G7I375_9SPHI|nr:SusE domain-containing protein [Mucilaginibacter pineti]SDF07048.1 SusE outer membrane protein [Mucilaginibacter pineti]
MKKLLTIILAVTGVGLLLLSSCKKDQTKVVTNVGKVGTLSANNLTPVLTKPTAADAAVTFNWQATNVSGYAAPISYTLQMDVKGNNFASPKEVAVSTVTKSFTVGSLNDVLLGLKLSFDVNTDVEVRVKSTAAANLAPTYSNVLVLTTKPFKAVSYVYVPGDYQGWSPASADSLKSPNSDGVYDGFIGFAAGGTLEFKITPTKASDFAGAYGDAGAGKLSTSGGNLKVPAPGYYALHVDLNTLTYTATPHVWGIVGNGTPGGWNTDTDMTYSQTSKTWSVTLALTAGPGLAMKFRYDHAWDVNLGGSTDALTQGGGDITVPATGTYKIVLDVNAGTFTSTKL